MSSEYEEIDEKTWKRAFHCQAFRNSLEPQYCISFELDIFRYRFIDGKIVLFHKINTA